MNGNLNVQTENIFPVIKKFLYSDHEIFLRELVSNAIDATQKLKALSSRGELKGETGDLTVEVEVDSKKKTLTVKDRGIGMTADEVEKYIKTRWRYSLSRTRTNPPYTGAARATRSSPWKRTRSTRSAAPTLCCT